MLNIKFLVLCLSLSHLVQNSVTQNTGSGPTLQQGYGSGCLARNGNCIIVKICNITVGVGSVNLTDPASECIQATPNAGKSLSKVTNEKDGQANAQLTFSPLPLLNLSISNVNVSPPNVNGTGYCNCTACPILCVSNSVSGCAPNNTNRSLITDFDDGLNSFTLTDLLDLTGLVFAGSGNFCAVQSPDPNCLGIILCNLKAYILGIEIEQGNLPPICVQGQGGFTARLSADNPFTLQLSNVNITNPLGNGACPCTACQQSCINNPYVGCLPTGVSTTTAFPYTSSTRSTCPWTTSSSRPRSTTKKS